MSDPREYIKDAETALADMISSLGSFCIEAIPKNKEAKNNVAQVEELWEKLMQIEAEYGGVFREITYGYDKSYDKDSRE
jgi:hypothetical protein